MVDSLKALRSPEALKRPWDLQLPIPSLVQRSTQKKVPIVTENDSKLSAAYCMKDNEEAWSYHGSQNYAGIWPLIIPDCHRLMQSPIDIFTFQVRRDPHTKPLRYFSYDQIIKTTDVVNNGQAGDCVENQLAVTIVFCTYDNLMPFDNRVLLDFFSFFFAVEVLRGGLCGNPIQDVNFIFVARCFDCAVLFGDRFMLGGSLSAVPKRWLTRGSKWNKRNTDQDANLKLVARCSDCAVLLGDRFMLGGSLSAAPKRWLTRGSKWNKRNTDQDDNLKLVARCSDCAVPPGDKLVLGLRGKMEVQFKLLTFEVVARCFNCFMSTGVIHVVISPENAKVGGEEEEMIIF
ncbi:hypothetical protein AVEN_156716-1 [Araneus ventricosus]|uniref:Alpha-carbonic anhydrase domain-containing protein n=1 Tax=Araneus ventricosus TaxID=182803 RepID=A0A4Y2WGF1_ARAVE|nr:hypothetical protein AVEN_156716-1 [Araneus ventricosus]